MRFVMALAALLGLAGCYKSAPSLTSDTGRDTTVDPYPDTYYDTLPDFWSDVQPDPYNDSYWDAYPDYYPDFYPDYYDVPPACPPGLTDCGGFCVDLLADLLHCGSCYSPCPEGTYCVVGTCIYDDLCEGVACRDGETCCYGLCVNTNRDPFNCGGCGIYCPWGADPDLSYLGCMDLALGVYNLCCGGRCLPVDNRRCGDCGFNCGSDGTCMGMWDPATGSCDFMCGGIISGSVGDACSDAERDCALVPSDARQCLTDFMGFVEAPGGYCSARCTGDWDCGPGATCVDLMIDRLCLKNCIGDDECRIDEGYLCDMLPYIGVGPYCIPIF